MPCSIDTCGYPPAVRVTFRASGATHDYCTWHAYRNGKLRWTEDAVSHTERIR